MARPLRVEYAGAVYHVTARGNERKAIYRGDLDRERFLIRLAAVVGRYRWKLHGFVLMRNHYHLLVETSEANLSPGDAPAQRHVHAGLQPALPPRGAPLAGGSWSIATATWRN